MYILTHAHTSCMVKAASDFAAAPRGRKLLSIICIAFSIVSSLIPSDSLILSPPCSKILGTYLYHHTPSRIQLPPIWKCTCTYIKCLQQCRKHINFYKTKSIAVNALLEYDETYTSTYPFYVPKEWILFLDGKCRRSAGIYFASSHFMCYFQ